MATATHAKRISGALLALGLAIGFSMTSTVASADDVRVNTLEGLKNTTADATVIVNGTINLSGDIDLQGRTIERAKGFTGALFTVNDGATVTISNGTIDGQDIAADAPLITVTKSTLTMSNVTIAGGVNNKTQVAGDAMSDNSWNSKGGAIGARQSTVNLDGVTISGNTATLGGGLFADGSTVNVNAGTKFEKNEASYGSYFLAHHYAAGGGIFAVSVHDNSTINVDSDTLFKSNGNLSQSTGGAIATGRLVKGKSESFNDADSSFGFGVHGYSTTLNVSGGDFTNNQAELAGGALYIQRNDIARVTGGNFESNYAKGENENENNIQQFAGGAIYIEGSGTNHAWENGGIGQNLPAGKLYLQNALITQNTALHGGGIAFCQTGDGFVGYAGAAIYGNEATGDTSEDIHIRRITSSPSSITLSRKAIGDVDNQWTSPDGDDPYFASNAKDRKFINGLTDADVKSDAVAVTFKNNSTDQWGGAIAANGEVIMGEQVGAFYIKKIDSVTKNPLGDAQFQLTGPDNYDVTVTTQTDGENSGEAAFRDLLAGEYTLVETKAPEGYPDLQLNWKVVVADAANKYAVTIYDADGNEIAPVETRDDADSNKYGVYELENTGTVTRDGELTPEIQTTATDNADGDKTVAAGKVEVKDVITYKDLMPGMEYTVKGKLVVKGTNGKDIVAEAQATFTPTAENGEVDIIFSVDTTQLAGKELVAYEYLFLGDVTEENIDLDTAEENPNFVTKHADDNDKAQTVTVDKNTVKLPVTGLSKTGDSVGIAAFAAIMLIAGGAVLLRRRQA